VQDYYLIFLKKYDKIIIEVEGNRNSLQKDFLKKIKNLLTFKEKSAIINIERKKKAS